MLILSDALIAPMNLWQTVSWKKEEPMPTNVPFYTSLSWSHKEIMINAHCFLYTPPF